jgi:hypothetical protein
MAHHNNTPESVLNAPEPMWAYVLDEDDNPIKFEGSNRQQRRALGMWGTNRRNRRGFSEPSMSARKLSRDGV